MQVTRLSLVLSFVYEIMKAALSLFVLLLIPQKLLENYTSLLINNNYANKLENVIFYKSGRTALSSIFQSALIGNPSNVILLPDYICNVVYLAAERAGAKIVTYSTDVLFRPNMNEIDELLKSLPVRAILFASIFGTQNNKSNFLHRVRVNNPDVLVIFDECQNLITNSQISFDPQTVMVISFNDKTIPGVMGGAICLPKGSIISIETPRQAFLPKLRHEISIIGMLFLRMMRKGRRIFRRSNHPLGSEFEYSRAVREPYDLEVAPISKISLAYACLGIKNLSQIEKRRKSTTARIENYLSKDPQLSLIKTESVGVAPLIPINLTSTDAVHDIGLDFKKPYAVYNNSNISLRPRNFSIINNPEYVIVKSKAGSVE